MRQHLGATTGSMNPCIAVRFRRRNLTPCTMARHSRNGICLSLCGMRTTCDELIATAVRVDTMARSTPVGAARCCRLCASMWEGLAAALARSKRRRV